MIYPPNTELVNPLDNKMLRSALALPANKRGPYGNPKHIKTRDRLDGITIISMASYVKSHRGQLTPILKFEDYLTDCAQKVADSHSVDINEIDLAKCYEYHCEQNWPSKANNTHWGYAWGVYTAYMECAKSNNELDYYNKNKPFFSLFTVL